MTASAAEAQRSLEITVTNLWKCFPDGRDYRPVLEDINLEIHHGEIVCLVGPSGCGKSTLLSIMAGLEPATLGEVRGGGEALGRSLFRSAVVFQRDLLLDWRSVLDNVLLGYLLRGESTRPHRDRARALLERVGLQDTEHLYPWQLSGGMRQRVAICRALVGDPEVLFMDEPFGALDALTRERLNDDLLEIARSGDQRKTIVFVTHDVAESVFLGDRVVVMGARPGRIVADIAVTLPSRTPKVRDLPEFVHYSAAVRAALHSPDSFVQGGSA